jgi:GT2 family glycosyltransferase
VRVQWSAVPVGVAGTANRQRQMSESLSPSSDNARQRNDLDRHVVTAVLIAHDGARWLPGTLKALLTQTRPVQRLVAADTGSTDRGPAVMAEVIGAGNLVTLPRTTGYGEAVSEALRHPAATLEVPETVEPGYGSRVEWIWLLHDDSAPAPSALEQLLAVADDNPHVGILGPKLRDWDDPRVLLEIGVTMDAAGRRDTGIDRREFDQGQHDGVKDVLAVSTAGMLIRRDVWDELGGFDVGLGLFRDDMDLCWRAHAAGHRVLAVSDAVMQHAEAAARRQRPVGMSSDHPRRTDRRNALYVLLANVPFPVMVRLIVRNIVVSLLRALVWLVVKKADAARAELSALRDVLRDVGGLRRMRADRAHNRSHAYRSIRRYQPRGLALRRLIDTIGNKVAGSGPAESDGRHRGFGESDEEEQLIVPESRWFSRLLANPGVITVLLLVAVTVAASRSLIASGGRLGGGALVPAWGGAHDLWSQYLAGWHPVGLGSATGSPPAVGVLAVLSTVLFGKPWLAVMVLLLGCVPLAGLTAYVAAKRIVPDAVSFQPSDGGPPPTAPAHRGRRRQLRLPAPVVRAWAAVTYALLPVATGAVTAGRLGTSVVMVLLPLIGLHAIQVVNPRRSDGARRPGRAAWGVALLLAVAMAFVPLTWLLAVVVGGLVWVAYGPTVPRLRRHLVIALAVPPLLLLPWFIGLILHPSRFLLEIGLHRPEIVNGRLPALSILALNPGGPGSPALWTTAGLSVLALLALPLRRRRTAVLGGWMLALFGLLVAVLVSAATVTKGADTAPAWPGVALAFASAGVLTAAVVGAQRALDVFAGRRLLPRLGGVLALAAALSVPALAAVGWTVTGGRGPLTKVNPDAIPAFIGVTGNAALQPRMLVLRQGADGGVSYSVLRGAVPALGESEIPTTDEARGRMDSLVAGLLAGRGNDESHGLARMGIHYLLVPNPARDPVTRVLDAAPEVDRLSRTEGFALWRLVTPGGRLMLVEGNKITPLEAGQTTAHVRIPPGNAARTLLLAEPADGGWHGALNGRDLDGKTIDGWAQSWDVPPGGGELSLSRGMLSRHIWLVLQAVAVVAVVALALPGSRTEEAATPETASAETAEGGPGTGSRRRAGVRRAGHALNRRRRRLRRPVEAVIVPDHTEPVLAEPVQDESEEPQPEEPQPEEPQPEEPQFERQESYWWESEQPRLDEPEPGPEPDEPELEEPEPYEQEAEEPEPAAPSSGTSDDSEPGPDWEVASIGHPEVGEQ